MKNDMKSDDGSNPGAGRTTGEDARNKNINIIRAGELIEREISDDEKIIGIPQKIFFRFTAFVLFILLILFFNYFVPVVQEIHFRKKATIANSGEMKEDAAYKKQISMLTTEIQGLSRKYDSYTSGQSYLVINTTDNRFLLYRSKKLVRVGFCSSGSYKLLQTEEGRRWIFKTPKGKFWIQEKTEFPWWKRPDWSFVEEGLPIPTENDDSRFEYGVLGDYALSLGEGYLIHGTIYKRFIGMPVTHGCVRLNDEDLKAIYNTLNIGSKVYIF